ncbi:MAG: transcription termination/antitermination NusG family protein [Thermoanaerobaculia bacterium]|jgi:transcription antitermination factor NusG
MPLLERGADIFPQGLFELPELDFPWWVAHVRSRQEKVLARHVAPLEVPFYFPQRENRRRRGGRSFVSYLPLLPGYFFFRGSVSQRSAVLRSNVVVRLLEVPDQALLTRELRELRCLQGAGATLTPYIPIAPGASVRVVEGPFSGYTGKVLRERSRLRLIVSISMLRQAVAVEFSREALSPLGPPRRFDQSRSAVGF